MKILYCIPLIILALDTQSQTPGQMPYQAIARNTSGAAIINHAIGLRFSIHDESVNGIIVWQEVQTVNSNDLGVINVNLGSINTLLNISWGDGLKFLQVEMDITGGVNYIDVGTQQLMSVPYAFFSNKSYTTENLPPGDMQGNTMYFDGQNWIFNSSNLYNNGNNVGVGTTQPMEKLEVAGNIALTGVIRAVEENQNITLQPSSGASVDVHQSRIIHVDTAASRQDAVSAELVQYSYLHFANASGGVNNIAVNLPVAITSYAPGLYVVVKISGTNTGAAELNVNNLGPRAIKKNGNEEIQAGDLQANLLVQLLYDGTAFQVMSPLQGANVNQYHSDSLLFTTDGF